LVLPCEADEAGDKFCAELRANLIPAHAAIYYRGPNGVPTQLNDKDSLPRRSEFDFFYFRNRSDQSLERPGAILVRIIYALKRAAGDGDGDGDNVTLLNNLKTVRRACKTTEITPYERFHGASRARNSCLKNSFHQTAPFNTFGPVERRRQFLFGVPGVDRRGFDDAALSVIRQIFEEVFSPENWKFQQGDSKSPNHHDYRSWLFNYSGQAKEGSCIRFNPAIYPEYTEATVLVTDLLEKAEGDFYPTRAQDLSFDAQVR
jgi:hypothetical protein